MPRYWVMAPVESKPADRFVKVWRFDLAQNVIAIGWKEPGDVTAMSRADLAEAVASTYPDKPSQTQALYANMLWAFYHDMLPGDYAIARRGRKTLVGTGKATGPAVFSPEKNPHIDHIGFVDVAWQAEPRDKSFPALSSRCIHLRSSLKRSSAVQLRAPVWP